MNDNFLTKEERKMLYQDLSDAEVFDRMQQIGSLVKFLAAVWDLHEMPSDDDRFRTLYQSFNKHLIYNYDYDIDEVIIDRLALLDDSSGETFKRFVIALLDRTFYTEEGVTDSDIFDKVLNILRDNLRPLGWDIIIFSYGEDGKERYKLIEISEIQTKKIPANIIPIKVTEAEGGNSSKPSNHTPPHNGPVLLLVFDNRWNDFGVSSKFSLYYYDRNLRRHNIGDIKILYKDDSTFKMSATDVYSTFNYLPNENILELGKGFCSLGQSKDYYTCLKAIFNENDQWISILLALRDVAYFSSIYDQFSDMPQWHSLIRSLQAENLVQEARPILHDIDVAGMYNFSYRFVPPYGNPEDEIKVNFEFDNSIKEDPYSFGHTSKTKIFCKRIYGIIGKNGVGKTHFLTSIPIAIATGQLPAFSGQLPLFRKVITVSNSYYDHFDIPESSLDFNYVYCGHLKKTNEGGKRGKTLKSRAEFMEDIHTNLLKISNRLQEERLKEYLVDLMPDNLISSCFVFRDKRCVLSEYEVWKDWIDKISSGEASLLHIFCSLVANVDAGSLILFDEPETHLHPNAITSLFNSLQQLCDDTNSFAIIATHSPMVIREIRSECVFVFSRQEDSCTVSKINYESFGASVDFLTEDIFGNREVQKSYLRIIDSLVNKYHMSEDDVIGELSSDGLPLGIGVRLYIHKLCESENA